MVNLLSADDMKRMTIMIAVFAIFVSSIFSPCITLAQEKAIACEVYFSPNGECTDAIIREINKAQNAILVQAYSFTSAPIAKALLNAHRRGIRVEVILDKSQRTQKYSSATFLFNAGIPTKIDAQHTIAHNKVMIIDGETVITGSFNFTKAAEKSNAENLLIIHDKELASLYTKNWQEHDKHSEAYAGRRQ
jgi:phosphatidylserine/phosphatidylglycerophosphate/cardiolipin synthase-like enzyme